MTGYTKYRIEKWVAIIGFGILAYQAFLKGTLGGSAGGVLLGLLLLAALMLLVRIIEHRERIYLASGTIELSACNEPWVRILGAFIYGLVIVLSVFSGDFIVAVGSLLVIGLMYIAACIPKPPSKSKMRQWYENGLTWLNDQLKPVPEPVTIPDN